LKIYDLFIFILTILTFQDIELEGEESSGGCSIYETIPPKVSLGKKRSTISTVLNYANTAEFLPTISATLSTNKNASSTTIGDQNKIAADDNVFSSDKITKIYACATMWHETETEMICMLKSIFR